MGSTSIELVFWLCIAWVGWVYFGYPAAIELFGRLRRLGVRAAPHTPPMTVIIAAYNEAEHIEATVRNKLAQDYPPERLDVIVVSDGSDDGTDDIVQGIDDPRVKLVRQEPRQGKTAGLNLAVQQATGELIVFSDANSLYEPGALRELAAAFADPEVGYATGRMIYGNPDGSVVGDGCTGYMRYENWLRAAETRAGSVVGVDGGIDAVRRELYHPMRPDQIPDFVLPLSVVQAGHRVVYRPQAVLMELALGEAGQEFRMRVRVSLRSLWALWDMRALLNPLRFPLFSFQLWSHKVLRYLAFIPLLALLPLNLLLLGAHPVYKLAMAAQVAFWLLAIAGGRAGAGRLTGWPYYFGMINWAAAVAFIRFLRRERQVTWTPRAG
jgi:cellulose synthase/poly-beta-1,6-N-acetylglucosamine synthase-like glycosyltransferase